MKNTITNLLLASALLAPITISAQTVSTAVGVQRSNLDAQTMAPFDNTTTTPGAARIVVPNGIAFDQNNKMYFSEWHKIRINDGTNVANRGGEPGDPNFTRAFWDATGVQSKMSEPAGMIVYSDNSLIFCDMDNHAIRKMSEFVNLGNAQQVTTLAGDVTNQSSLNGYGNPGTADGTGTAASFNRPSDLTVDKDGIIYICDKFNNSIRKLQFVNGQAVITTFAGLTGEANTGNTNGVGTAARFNTPTCIAYDATTHTLIVTDFGNGSLRKIDIATKTVSTLLPNNTTTTGYVDGSISVANTHSPYGVCVDGDGNILFTERQRGVIRMIAKDGTVSTVAGQDDKVGYQDGPGSSALFAGPERIAYNSTEDAYYITDYDNSVIRKLVLPEVADFTVDKNTGTTNTTFQFTDLSGGDPTEWKWSFNPDNAEYQGGTDSSSQNPQVMFSSQGFYSVTLEVVTSGGNLSVTKNDYMDISTAASVDALNNSFTVNVYPNPSTGVFNIHMDGLMNNAEVYVSDITGKTVAHKTNVSGTDLALDLTNLNSGIYFVTVINDGQRATTKVVIK